MKILVDTDIIINHFKDKSKPGYSPEELNSNAEIFISIITITELWSGLNLAKRPKAELLLKLVHKIEIDPQLATNAGILRYNYALKGISISTTDALIAASALENNFHLASHDKIFTKIKNLKLYKP